MLNIHYYQFKLCYMQYIYLILNKHLCINIYAYFILHKYKFHCYNILFIYFMCGYMTI